MEGEGAERILYGVKSSIIIIIGYYVVSKMCFIKAYNIQTENVLRQKFKTIL